MLEIALHKGDFLIWGVITSLRKRTVVFATWRLLWGRQIVLEFRLFPSEGYEPWAGISHVAWLFLF